MTTIHAIYENGVFRPTAPIDLPENTSVEILLPATSGSDRLQQVRDAIAVGAAELDAGQIVDAESVFAEMTARRARLHAERRAAP
jgi:predicted DNA-binding antitoxin AbrB/MazE fold protein